MKEYIPLGGETFFGEQLRDCACRKVKAESGRRVNPNPEDLILIETVIVYPEKEIGGIRKAITTFVYFMKDDDEEPDIFHQEYENGCKITSIVKPSMPEFYQWIEMGEIKLYGNFIQILLKIHNCIEERLGRVL